MTSRFAPLRDANFARVFAARLISAFGTPMAPVALPFAVLEDLHGSARDVGLVIAAAAGAQVVFQIFAGALADPGSRRAQLVTGDLSAAAAPADRVTPGRAAGRLARVHESPLALDDRPAIHRHAGGLVRYVRRGGSRDRAALARRSSVVGAHRQRERLRAHRGRLRGAARSL